MNGIILINKEKNKTSRDMVNELSHFFRLKKVGHTGTLDPIATGVLVMCLGRYTKLALELSSLEKEYIATVKIGIKTDTLDITGNVVEEVDTKMPSENVIKEVLASMTGDFTQTIPIYSAKKINGKKLYEYARENIAVDLPKNIVKILNIQLLKVTKDTFTFKTLVSKGTYIRSLIEEICKRLNIIGTMSDLIRTKQGNFSLKDTYTINDVKNNNFKLLSLKDLTNYPIYNLNEQELFKVKNGCKMDLNIDTNKVIMCYKNKEIALYEKKGDKLCLIVMLNIDL